MTNRHFIRAWKDEQYRLGLSEAERPLLPENKERVMQTTETTQTSTRTRAVPRARLAVALQDIVDEYVKWRRDVMPTLPEDEQLFRRTVDGHTIWVLEDGPTFTILCPDVL